MLRDASLARYVATLAWGATAALIGLHVTLLWRFAVDWPLHDDYTQILAMPGYLVQLSATQKLGLLFGFALEHRPAVLRLIAWLTSALPGGLDFRLLIGVGNAMAIAAGACVVVWFPRQFRAGAALLAALLLTSVTHFAAQYHALGALQHFGVSLFGLLALRALCLRQRWLAGALGLLLALAATFTSASGLVVFPAAALLLAMQRRQIEALAWLLIGALAFALYFTGFERPAALGDASSLDPRAIVGFVLATLGCIGYGFDVSRAIGALILAAWVALLASGGWHRVAPIVTAAFVFVAITCALIAIGRAGLGAEAVTLSRYRMYSALCVLLTCAALAQATPARWWSSVQVGAIAGSAALFVLAWMSTLSHLVFLSMMQAAYRDHYYADGRGHYDGYAQAFGDFTLRRARDLGSFDASLDATPALIAVQAMLPTQTARASHYASVYPGERFVSVAGWVESRSDAIDLWLEDAPHAFRVPLASVSYRGAGFAPHAGFHGTIRLEGLPAGSYRIGLSARRDPAVTWTTMRVQVR